MNKLMRRAALGLALPLGIGAPVVLVAGPAYADATSTAVAIDDSTPVYGQLVTATATVTSGGQPVTAGSVQFKVKNPGGSFTSFGGPVSLDATGHAVSSPVTQQNGHPMDVTGPYLVRADYVPGGPGLDPSTDTSDAITVSEAGSSTAVHPGPSTIVADVVGALPGGMQPGSAVPTGSVSFQLNGQPIGSATLDSDGVATLSYVVPSGRPQTVTASYDGSADDNYQSSQATRTRRDPEITARVLSKFPRTRTGWYRNSVSVWFKCDPAGSELVVECPDSVTLRNSGKNKRVTKTIVAADGGTASITISGIDIDRQKPVISVQGRHSCRATDKLSGVAGHRCKMVSLGHGRFLAIAVDRAGNRAVKPVRFL